MWPFCHIPPPLIDGWWKNGHHLEGGMSTAKYRNFHTGLNLFVLINILSQLIVPFSEMYSAVLEKADHPHSSAVHEFGTVFFGKKVWSLSEISIIQFSSGGLFKTKEPFWNFVCLLMPWFNPICVDLCKYAYELVEKTFLSYDFGKGQYTFYPVKLSRFLEKK